MSRRRLREMSTHDLVCDIMPIGAPGRRPMRCSANIPSQEWIGGPRLAANPSRLQLREVGFEEANLVFAVDGGWVGGRFLYTEMIPHLASVDGSRGLRDQLCPPHRLAIPIRGRVARIISRGTE
jgi:hypothetical protein